MHVGRARLVGVPTDWCDDLTGRMATFEGHDTAARSIEGLAIEARLRSQRAERGGNGALGVEGEGGAGHESSQVQGSEDVQRRSPDEGGAAALEAEQRTREDNGSASANANASAALVGVIAKVVSKGVRLRQVSGTPMRVWSAEDSSQPAQQPYIEVPPVPGRAGNAVEKRKGVESGSQPKAKRPRIVAKGKGRGAPLLSGDELKLRGEMEADGIWVSGVASC